MMAESSMRNVGRVNKDFISELPPNVIETILCFLPIDDAVRTGILSRAWKNCWIMIPHLVFDYEFVYRIITKYSHYDDLELKAHKFASVINKVLLQHNGPILKLFLPIPGDSCDTKILHEYIDQWMPLLSRNGINQLILEDLELQEVMPHHFSSLDLTHLRLVSVWFAYKPTFERFTYLTTLELINATSNFGKTIFNCPVLEKLTLIICEGLFPNNFCAPKLKCLHQVYSIITSEYTLAGLENLEEFSFLLSGYMDTQHIISKTKTSNVVKVLDGVHKIEKFSIAWNFSRYLAAGGSPNRLSKPLPYLKRLNISDINFNQSEVSCLLCLIRSAPNLCKLCILADPDPEEWGLKNYRIEDSEDFTIGHLEIITFSHFVGHRVELELVKFLLAHSPLLKVMFIHRSKQHIRGLAEKMLQYSRSSSRAEIRFLKQPVAIDEFDYELWQNFEIN